jgi:outer membrane protein OmpA-like peptidoglycan-associated protein
MSFALGSAELTASAKAALDRFAAALARIPKWRPFAVEGHTDRSGSRELNLALSAARARSVVDYLASKGVDRRQMKARGYGYDRPLQGRGADDPANRRVELFAS